MPTPVKALDNMSKHMTKAERDARESQEGSTLPTRKIKKPALLKTDKAASRHWARIVKDMAGLDILDALDADALGIYCAKLARRDDLQQRYLEARGNYGEEPDKTTLRLMISLSAEIQAIERDLLAYASKLGLTPESRIRFAKRIAEQEESDDPDWDLFAR